MRILEVRQPQEVAHLMQEIGVDPYGIKLMVLKAQSYLLRINGLPCIAANIIKQEMLSVGADAALSKGALTGGKIKKTDCLLFGTLAQLNRLCEKLSKQPFGLQNVSQELELSLNNYKKDNFIFCCADKKLVLGKKPRIMGIVNLTTDSFSGDGVLQVTGDRARLPLAGRGTVEKAVAKAQQMVKEGADIIDVGGESSRPGAKSITLKEELNRVIPVIAALVNKIKVPISIDTYKPEIAKAALNSGAVIINDIAGLRNPKMRKVAANFKAGVVMMHMKGNPGNMQKLASYSSLIDELISYFKKAFCNAIEAGVSKESIIIDPGIGFAKSTEHNLEVLKHLRELKILGLPILVGTSRKSFIGKILGALPEERIFGTVASSVVARMYGASIVRVHDVGAVSQALKVSSAITD